jgi:hypothetical protein
VHLFADAGHVPVRTYIVEDTAVALNEASLWEMCTSRVAGLFATLPCTDQAVNEESKLKASTVHARKYSTTTRASSADVCKRQ